MAHSIDLYEAIANAPDERKRAFVIAQAFARFLDRHPELRMSNEEYRLAERERLLRAEFDHLRTLLHDTESRLGRQIQDLRIELQDPRHRLQQAIDAQPRR
jgi:hypothetical protein